MKLADIFETRIEERIDPVIKVSEVHDESKLAAEIGSYVVTPTIERYTDEFIEHYTDTVRLQTTEIGSWISGYFGSGKSHLAKVLALLVENRTLQGHPATKRFEARVPAAAPRRASILRNLNRLDQCSAQVLAFNLNTLVDSRTTPLPKLLLSQYYQARGYCSNLLYARVIEQEIDRRGKLDALHAEVASLAGCPWADIQKNPGFYARHLYQAACKVAPDAFATPGDVAQALKNAESGDLYNVQFLVQTLLHDLAARERQTKKPCRILLVLDESGQWIEDDAGRLAQLQALVEESAVKGQGKIWIFVTTHEDMGAIYQNARALQADMKKIEGRFRFKWSLTTENIELVLEDRIFKKTLTGRDEVGRAYDAAPGVLRGLGELANVEGRRLPDCDRERFITFYPFFPYHLHLIPDIVKSLRSRGGRGEQLSGSTRTLLAISQDILRAGRRPYLNLAVGELVPFDEVYGNLAGEGEVSPDVRRELSVIEQVVPGATGLTRRIAEILYLVREVAYLPRTLDNIARLLVESTSDDLPQLTLRIQPELDRLIAAKMVARIGDEYEFLTGERRTFEDEVATVAAQLRHQDREAGLAKHFVYDPEKKANHLRSLLGFDTVEFKGVEFDVRVSMDGTLALKDGDVEVRIFSPLAALGGTKVADLEDQSLRADEQNAIFLLCDRIPGFDQDLSRFLATGEVINAWKGDSRRSDEARTLAKDREASDLDKLRRKVEAGIREGLRCAQLVFRGSSRALSPRPGQTPGQALRAELTSYFPSIYPKFEKVPIRIADERRAIEAALAGQRDQPDVKALRLFDKGGTLDPQSPVVDAIRIFLSTRQARNERSLGKDLLAEFSAPPYGWDPNAVRVGIAACIRAGSVKLLIGKMPHTNPADPVLHKALRDSREFEKVDLVLEDSPPDSETLEAVRAALIKLTGKRKIDETPAALHDAMQEFGDEKLALAKRIRDWADAASFPLPGGFNDGLEALSGVLALSNPLHRVKEIHARADDLRRGVEAIDQVAAFHEKWRTAFNETKQLASQLRAIEHLLPSDGAVRRFLAEYETAAVSSRLGEMDVWKSVQTAKAAAALELETFLASRRDEARRIATAARDRLPDDLKGQGVSPALAGELGSRLEGFVASLESEKEPARIAVLPERAQRLVREIGDAIRSEIEKAASQVPEGQQPVKRAREVRIVRFADVATLRRIRTEAEWQQLARKLDERIRMLLRDFDVELE
ncbi:MAG: BREX system P-loop protein BrxC [Candidatus Rokubacteria bacterium]|nr:BREX system P-loop protein BrxC [Candidatus Rokubacteria bacterium]